MKRGFLSLAACALALALAGPATAADAAKAPAAQKIKLPPPASALDRVRRAGVLRVGVVVRAPWTFEGKDGELVGYDVDVVRQLADDLGVRLELVRASMRGAADEVAAGNVDMTAAGLWFSPRRALVVNFTRPYGTSELQLVATREKASGRSAHEAWDATGVKLGARSGGPSEQAARAAFPKATIVSFDDDREEVAALLDGRIDAAVGMTPAPEFVAAQVDPKLVLPLGEPLGARSESFAIARGDVDFLAYLDGWIRYREDTGWLKERRDYWFRSLDWADRVAH